MSMKPGDKLNNGALIIATSLIQKELALCLWNGEYVIWSVTPDGEAYWGSYFQDDFFAAANAFKDKIED